MPYRAAQKSLSRRDSEHLKKTFKIIGRRGPLKQKSKISMGMSETRSRPDRACHEAVHEQQEDQLFLSLKAFLKRESRGLPAFIPILFTWWIILGDLDANILQPYKVFKLRLTFPMMWLPLPLIDMAFVTVLFS